MKLKIIQQCTSKVQIFGGILLCAAMILNAGNKAKMADVPKEVQDIIDNYFIDSTQHEFNDVRKTYNIDPSIKFSDLEAGIPIERYFFNIDSLTKASEDISIKNLIKPINEWFVPIQVNGKFLYCIHISFFQGRMQLVGLGPYLCDIMQKVRTAWPESTGINPVCVDFGTYDFLHFPQIDDYNLLYVVPGFKVDSLDMLLKIPTDKLSNNSLSGGKVIIRWLKKEYKKNTTGGKK